MTKVLPLRSQQKAVYLFLCIILQYAIFILHRIQCELTMILYVIHVTHYITVSARCKKSKTSSNLLHNKMTFWKEQTKQGLIAFFPWLSANAVKISVSLTPSPSKTRSADSLVKTGVLRKWFGTGIGLRRPVESLLTDRIDLMD